MTSLSRTTIALMLLASAAPALIAGASRSTYAHEGEFSAGEPGNPNKQARIVQITMREGDGKMLFIPDRIEIRKGEQIRFVIPLWIPNLITATNKNIIFVDALCNGPFIVNTRAVPNSFI